MSQPTQPAWFRGPIEGILPQLQPAAQTFIQVAEDVESVCAPLTHEELWRNQGSAAPLGFHLQHLAGSTFRLMAYARGQELTEEQFAAAKQEKEQSTASAAQLVANFRSAIDSALDQIRNTPESLLYAAREVGRAKLPSTTIGLIFHAAEHAYRHSGQIATTVKLMK